MKSNYKRIGDYIRIVDERNTDLSVKNLLGLSITKEFVPSVANTVGTDMSKYKIVKKNQFVCSTMQVRRDKKMPVALLQHVEEGIISPAYYVFEVIDENILLPEYLMMWFSRSEFDREACFYAIGGVRGSLEWEDFCDMKLPIPLIGKQREIVKEYNTILKRIKLNKNMIERLEELAQIIYKQYTEEFNIDNNGEMKYCEELDREIPLSWDVKKLGEVIDYKKGYAFKSDIYSSSGKKIIKVSNFNEKYINDTVDSYIEIDEAKKYMDYEIKTNDIIVSTVGSWPNNQKSIVGKVILVPKTVCGGLLNQNAVRIRSKNKLMHLYIYCCLFNKKYSQYVISGAQGSANQASVTLEHIFDYDILIPDDDTLYKIEKKLEIIFNMIQIKITCNKYLNLLRENVLLKISNVEE